MCGSGCCCCCCCSGCRSGGLFFGLRLFGRFFLCFRLFNGLFFSLGSFGRFFLCFRLFNGLFFSLGSFGGLFFSLGFFGRLFFCLRFFCFGLFDSLYCFNRSRCLWCEKIVREVFYLVKVSTYIRNAVFLSLSDILVAECLIFFYDARIKYFFKNAL